MLSTPARRSGSPGSPGAAVLPLHGFGSERVSLVRWAPNTRFVAHEHQGGEEIFVLDGAVEDEQVFPAALPEMVRDTDQAKSARAMRAMLGMKKLDIAELRAAYEGNNQETIRFPLLRSAEADYGHVEQNRAGLPEGAGTFGACGISGVVALSPILWLSHR